MKMINTTQTLDANEFSKFDLLIKWVIINHLNDHI